LRRSQHLRGEDRFAGGLAVVVLLDEEDIGGGSPLAAPARQSRAAALSLTMSIRLPVLSKME